MGKEEFLFTENDIKIIPFQLQENSFVNNVSYDDPDLLKELIGPQNSSILTYQNVILIIYKCQYFYFVNFKKIYFDFLYNMEINSNSLFHKFNTNKYKLINIINQTKLDNEKEIIFTNNTEITLSNILIKKDLIECDEKLDFKILSNKDLINIVINNGTIDRDINLKLNLSDNIKIFYNNNLFVEFKNFSCKRLDGKLIIDNIYKTNNKNEMDLEVERCTTKFKEIFENIGIIYKSSKEVSFK